MIILSTNIDTICQVINDSIVSGQESAGSIALMNDEELFLLLGVEVSKTCKLRIDQLAEKIEARHERGSFMRFLKNELTGNQRQALKASFPEVEFAEFSDHVRIYPGGMSDG